MVELVKKTQAYRLLEKECAGNACSHAYLLLFNDSKNLRFSLKEFAKLLFAGDVQERERREKLIDEDAFSDCLCFPTEGKKLTVEDAEKIREEALLSPIEGERKVKNHPNGDMNGHQTETTC